MSKENIIEINGTKQDNKMVAGGHVRKQLIIQLD